MGVVSHMVKKEELKPGNHIYTYRARYTYSHHGIYVGENKVVHFTTDNYWNLCCSSSGSSNVPTSFCCGCPSFPERGTSTRPNNGVIVSSLDCFLGEGSLHLYNYGVFSITFVVKRGGSCTTAKSDSPETVIYRAMHLLQHGFGNFKVWSNNCEDFALFCKTGLIDKQCSSGQAKWIKRTSCVAVVSTALGFLVPPVSVATVSAVMYFTSRYGSDIGARSTVAQVLVEDLTVNSSRNSVGEEELAEAQSTSSG